MYNEITQETDLQKITTYLFQYHNNIKHDSKENIPIPNLYLHICLHGSTNLKKTQEDVTDLSELLKEKMTLPGRTRTGSFTEGREHYP